MLPRKFSVCLWLFLILFCPVYSANGDDDLFSKLKIQPMKDGKKAPEFSLDGLSGRKGELKNFRGKIIFLSFWATWCGPCKEELPSIEALHRYFKGKDFVVLTVAVDIEGVSPVEKFLARHGYTFHVLTDPKGETLDLYRVEKIPMAFLIDKKGRIVGKAMGPRDWKSPEALSLFTRLIETIEK
jgi:cytochrome c biogenesis protein CcmG/thiol:disulfide interchange protein DsbE